MKSNIDGGPEDGAWHRRRKLALHLPRRGQRRPPCTPRAGTDTPAAEVRSDHFSVLELLRDDDIRAAVLAAFGKLGPAPTRRRFGTARR
jgi:hypothetical protein